MEDFDSTTEVLGFAPLLQETREKPSRTQTITVTFCAGLTQLTGKDTIEKPRERAAIA